MDSSQFASSTCGRVVRTRTHYDAFVPAPLPPTFEWNGAVRESLEQADAALGAFSRSAAGRAGFPEMLLRIDAVHASNAEGEACTVAALLEAEASGRHASPGVRLGLNYVAAFEHVRARLDELPLSLRLVREMHYVLADGVAEPRTTPGYFRTSQNWVGPAGCGLEKADFVPPPPEEMRELLRNWEQYLYAEDDAPAAARIAIAHYQLLALHPFLTLNVALGALAATVILSHTGLASTPTAFAGAFVARRSAELLQRMLGLSRTGAWDRWLLFHACGLADAALQAGETLRRLTGVNRRHEELLDRNQADGAMRRLAQLLLERPARSTSDLAEATGLAGPDLHDAIERLTALGTAARQPGSSVVTAPDVIAALEPQATNPLDYGAFF